MKRLLNKFKQKILDLVDKVKGFLGFKTKSDEVLEEVYNKLKEVLGSSDFEPFKSEDHSECSSTLALQSPTYNYIVEAYRPEIKPKKKSSKKKLVKKKNLTKSKSKK